LRFKKGRAQKERKGKVKGSTTKEGQIIGPFVGKKERRMRWNPQKGRGKKKEGFGSSAEKAGVSDERRGARWRKGSSFLETRKNLQREIIATPRYRST